MIYHSCEHMRAVQRGRAAQMRDGQASRVEDLVAIGGLAVPTAVAARRIGVHERTVRIYKAILRSRGYR